MSQPECATNAACCETGQHHRETVHGVNHIAMHSLPDHVGTTSNQAHLQRGGQQVLLLYEAAHWLQAESRLRSRQQARSHRCRWKNDASNGREEQQENRHHRSKGLRKSAIALMFTPFGSWLGLCGRKNLKAQKALRLGRSGHTARRASGAGLGAAQLAAIAAHAASIHGRRPFSHDARARRGSRSRHIRLCRCRRRRRCSQCRRRQDSTEQHHQECARGAPSERTARARWLPGCHRCAPRTAKRTSAMWWRRKR